MDFVYNSSLNKKFCCCNKIVLSQSSADLNSVTNHKTTQQPKQCISGLCPLVELLLSVAKKMYLSYSVISKN